MRRGLIIVNSLLFMIVLLTGCGSGQSAQTVDMAALENQMLSADDSLEELTKVNSDSEQASDLFAYVSDMDYSKVQSYFLDYAADGTADEIVVICLKDKKDVDEAVKSLQTHLQNRVNLYTSYGPDQVDKAKNAVVFSQNNYVALIACNHQSAVKAAFEKVMAE